MGVGRQQRGPFQGVRVKNSVKELLLHIRSHKQKASGQAVDDFKVVLLFSFVFELGLGEISLSGPISFLQFFIEDNVPERDCICFALCVFWSLSPVPGIWKVCRKYNE